MVMIQNTIFIIGKYVFNKVLGPQIDRFLNHYKFDFYMWSPFRGQNRFTQMQLDYRQVYAPWIGDGFVNLYAWGELSY